MKQHGLVALLALAALGSGCGSDSAPASANGTLVVTISSPNATVYTNGGIVSFKVDVTGGKPDNVFLVVGPSTIATLTPPYAFDWDTSNEPEARNEVRARAALGQTLTESPVRLVIIDRTPPTVTNRTPAPGATDVAFDASPLAEFSEPLLVDSVVDSAVSLKGKNGASIDKSLLLSPDGTKLTITPTSAVVASVDITASLTGLTDLAGNALVSPKDAWKWHVPYWIKLGGPLVPSKKGVIAAVLGLGWDSSAKPMAAVSGFFTSVSGTNNLGVSTWDGSQWTAPVTNISGADFLAATNLLGLDGSGAPLLLNGKQVVRFDGKVWRPLGATLGDYPVMAVDPSGRPVVAFPNLGAPGSVEVHRWSGTAWQALGAPFSNAALSNVAGGPPRLAFDRAGNPVVAWIQLRTSTTFDYALSVRRWDGLTWQPVGPSPDMSTGRPAPSGCFDVTVDGQDHVIAGWTGRPAQTTNSGYVVTWSGSAWIDVGATFPQIGCFHLATDAGTPMLLADVAATLEVRKLSGSTWQLVGEPIPVPQTNETGAQFAVDKKSNVLIAYNVQDGVTGTPFVVHQNR